MAMNITKKKQKYETSRSLSRKAKNYKAKFDRIITEGLPIYRNKNFTTFYEIKDGEVFKQCFTNDKKAKYYKARNQIAPYYFISNYGTLVTMKGGKASIVSLHPRDKKQSNCRCVNDVTTYKGKNRVSKRVTYDPATLVALTFEADADSEALAIIQECGLDAFNHKGNCIGAVECHHKQDYKRGSTFEETKALLPINCRVDNLEFVCRKIHIQLTNAQPIVDNEEQLKKELERIQETNKVLASHGLIDHAVVFDLDIEKDGDSYTVTKRTVEEPTHIRATIKPINAEAKAAEQATRQQDARYIVDIARRDPEPKDGMLIESEDKQRLYSVTLL